MWHHSPFNHRASFWVFWGSCWAGSTVLLLITYDNSIRIDIFLLCHRHCRQRHYVFELSICPFVLSFVCRDRSCYILRYLMNGLSVLNETQQGIFIIHYWCWLDSGGQRSKVKVTAGRWAGEGRHPHARCGIEVHLILLDISSGCTRSQSCTDFV